MWKTKSALAATVLALWAHCATASYAQKPGSEVPAQVLISGGYPLSSDNGQWYVDGQQGVDCHISNSNVGGLSGDLLLLLPNNNKRQFDVFLTQSQIVGSPAGCTALHPNLYYSSCLCSNNSGLRVGRVWQMKLGETSSHGFQCGTSVGDLKIGPLWSGDNFSFCTTGLTVTRTAIDTYEVYAPGALGQDTAVLLQGGAPGNYFVFPLHLTIKILGSVSPPP
jgi:hypothetical protein